MSLTDFCRNEHEEMESANVEKEWFKGDVKEQNHACKDRTL